MKNFSSALIKQESTKNTLNNIVEAIGDNKNVLNMATDIVTGIIGSKAEKNLSNIENKLAEGMNTLSSDERIDNIRIGTNGWFIQKDVFKKQITDGTNIVEANVFSANTNNIVKYEDPFNVGAIMASVINNYKFTFSHAIPQQLEQLSYNPKDNVGKMTFVESVHTPSLFNPNASINVIGITENIPLIQLSEEDSTREGDYMYDNLDEDLNGTKQDIFSLHSNVYSKDENISDCSIRALVNESKKPGGGCLGLATYRFIDFMYCKDLGKIPNNRLITLRRFSAPVNDNIFRSAHPNAQGNDNQELNPAKGIQDIGRLITWFDNDDNHLEDICQYQYHATWKQFEAKIQQEASEQQDVGMVDKIANFLSPSNNILTGQGFSGNNSLLYNVVGKLKIPYIGTDRMNQPYYNMHLLSNYDQNRIYEPPNRVWDTHKYEGKLVFSQDITLVFRYTLRGYENINPKTAFLDLIGNIQTVTYRSGSFWGGQNQVYGPSGNSSVYNKANAWIDKGFDKLGGFWRSLTSGELDISMIQEIINNALDTAKEYLGKAKEKAEEITEDLTENNGEQTKQNALEGLKKYGKYGNILTEYNEKYHWTDALKGMLKNQLGRPAMYAFNSLLTGEAVGPWHLTIGNPKNPILVMGNLIMENATTQHLGPLGLDDFPTEIKVTVQLKHAKSRDSIDIQKMYTKGVSSIYHSMKFVKTSNYWYNDQAFGDLTNIYATSPMLLRKGLSSI